MVFSWRQEALDGLKVHNVIMSRQQGEAPEDPSDPEQAEADIDN